MSDELSPHELTAQQLFEERDRLRHIPPQLLTVEDGERLQQVETELGRRIDRGDRELYAPANEGLEREYEQLPDLPKEEEFAPDRLSRRATRDLEALRADSESRLEGWKAYDRTIPAASEREKSHEQEKRTWLEKRSSERAELILEQGLRNIRHELARRALKAGPSPEAAAPAETSAPPQTEERPRSGPRSKTRSDFRREARSYLSEHRKASARDVCAWCDQHDVKGPENWYVGVDNQRELWVIYADDPAIRRKIDKYVSRIRADVE